MGSCQYSIALNWTFDCDLHVIPKFFIIIASTEVLKSERDKAFKKYEPNRDMVKETISFGRRADGPPPKVYYPPSTAATVYHPEIEDSKY